jgi:hypothetical protein
MTGERRHATAKILNILDDLGSRRYELVKDLELIVL